VAIGGTVLFGIITIWAFGREFSDHTVKDLLALPTSRTTIVTAKCIVIAVWSILLTLFVFGTGILIGKLVNIPGWSMALLGSSLVDILGASLLTIALLPFVALITSMGRGYLVPFGWVVLTIILAQIVAFTGWGDFFPWAIPALFSNAAGPRADLLGPHSYFILLASCILGLAALYYWWRTADQTK
jgi:ABC-2 type transport system permease protein